MSNQKNITKKIPLRQCLGCREMKPKKEMLRIVRNNEGEVFLDFKGKASGRGTYVCGNETCVDNCIKHKMLNKAFSCNISQEIYNSIKEAFLATK